MRWWSECSQVGKCLGSDWMNFRVLKVILRCRGRRRRCIFFFSRFPPLSLFFSCSWREILGEKAKKYNIKKAQSKCLHTQILAFFVFIRECWWVYFNWVTGYAHLFICLQFWGWKRVGYSLWLDLVSLNSWLKYFRKSSKICSTSKIIDSFWLYSYIFCSYYFMNLNFQKIFVLFNFGLNCIKKIAIKVRTMLVELQWLIKSFPTFQTESIDLLYSRLTHRPQNTEGPFCWICQFCSLYLF